MSHGLRLAHLGNVPYTLSQLNGFTRPLVGAATGGSQVVQEGQAGQRVTIRQHHGLPARRIVSKVGTSCWAPDQPTQRLIRCCQRLYFTPCTQLTGAELCGSRHYLLLCG